VLSGLTHSWPVIRIQYKEKKRNSGVGRRAREAAGDTGELEEKTAPAIKRA